MLKKRKKKKEKIMTYNTVGSGQYLNQRFLENIKIYVFQMINDSRNNPDMMNMVLSYENF